MLAGVLACHQQLEIVLLHLSGADQFGNAIIDLRLRSGFSIFADISIAMTLRKGKHDGRMMICSASNRATGIASYIVTDCTPAKVYCRIQKLLSPSLKHRINSPPRQSH